MADETRFNAADAIRNFYVCLFLVWASIFSILCQIMRKSIVCANFIMFSESDFENDRSFASNDR